MLTDGVVLAAEASGLSSAPYASLPAHFHHSDRKAVCQAIPQTQKSLGGGESGLLISAFSVRCLRAAPQHMATDAIPICGVEHKQT